MICLTAALLSLSRERGVTPNDVSPLNLPFELTNALYFMMLRL